MTQKHTENMSDDELRDKRDEINDTLMDDMDSKQGSADASADDEKKKYIAQHGDAIKDAERAQDVPEPVSDEVKSEQNVVAMEENRGRELTEDERAHVMGEDTEQVPGERVTEEQHDKLADKVTDQ